MIPADVRRTADILLGEISKVRDTVSSDFLCTGSVSVVIDDHQICVEATRRDFIVRITPPIPKS